MRNLILSALVILVIACTPDSANDEGLIDTPQIGSWETSRTTDPVHETEVVSFTLEALMHNLDLPYDSPTLEVRCSKNDREVLIYWGGQFMAMDGVLRGYTRWGTQGPILENWAVSTTGKSTFHPSPDYFLKRAMETNLALIRVHDFQYLENDAQFILVGLEEAMEAHADLCDPPET